MKTAKHMIGSVSHGTMREEDLIPCFIDTIEYFSKRRARQLRKEYDSLLQEMKDAKDDTDCFETLGYFLNETLFDALDSYALPYFYFGAHPGDGSDYGFWLSDGFQEDFDGLKVSDTSEVPKGYRGEVLHVNDHGNMTLYAANRGKLREVWALV